MPQRTPQERRAARRVALFIVAVLTLCFGAIWGWWQTLCLVTLVGLLWCVSRVVPLSKAGCWVDPAAGEVIVLNWWGRVKRVVPYDAGRCSLHAAVGFEVSALKESYDKLHTLTLVLYQEGPRGSAPLVRLTRIYSLYRAFDDVERVLLEEWLAVLARDRASSSECPGSPAHSRAWLPQSC